ncbi:putative hydroxypyruvate isomerase [Sparus aurata]|uniref:putative hydroxypyruvate isomerase n=1 Tax=Sparus aurata TaxID=8175 RepID=UPI0011C1A71C|nr:putative hydroxypyruvate isomerase [Sparus aurata]
MAPLKFCANISWLFTELPHFSQRIYAAASASFEAVEAAWLYESDLQELQRAKEATGVEVVLINTPPGDVNAGDLGLGAVPGREAEFRQGLDLALTYARALGCKRIHLMAGRVPLGSNRQAVVEEMEAVFVQNLNYAADILSKVGDLLRPTCEAQYAKILKAIQMKNSSCLSLSGHVQIAQVPCRNEPNSAGELNYRYLFNTLENHGYQGYIGCEYKPSGSTKEGLGWLKDYCTHSK